MNICLSGSNIPLRWSGTRIARRVLQTFRAPLAGAFTSPSHRAKYEQDMKGQILALSFHSVAELWCWPAPVRQAERQKQEQAKA